MKRDEAFEAEEILKDLERYQHNYIKDKIARLSELLQPIIENEKIKEFKEKRNIKTSYNNFTPHREAHRAANALNSIITLYDEAKDEVNKYQKETQDILHALELADLSDEEMNELAKELKHIRMYRRSAKNFVESAGPLYQFAINHRKLGKDLGKVAGEIAKITKFIAERRYTPRVNTALAEAFDKARQDMDENEGA
jgi:hypothetical protein